MRAACLSGGVGGARLAAGLAAVDGVDLTVVVNVGDDDEIHGLYVAADIDSVVYKLAGVEGPRGWGRADDTFRVIDEMARFGVDNRFRIGDLDLATCLYRTTRMAQGDTLSEVTRRITAAMRVEATIMPASDDEVRTKVRTAESGWLDFQDYFVLRGHRETVLDVRYQGSDLAKPAPGVVEAIIEADLVVIAPSNPPLSVWPILSIAGVADAVADHPNVVAVSPLIGGRAVRGPAAEVMISLGLPSGTNGVIQAYTGLLQRLVVDATDADTEEGYDGLEVVMTDISIGTPEAARRLASLLVDV